LGIGDWGLGIRDFEINNKQYNIKSWGLGIGDWAIPNPQSPIPNFIVIIINHYSKN